MIRQIKHLVLCGLVLLSSLSLSACLSNKSATDLNKLIR